MPYFKNESNELFWLDESDDPTVWLVNCTQITDAEAEELRLQLIEPVLEATLQPDEKLKAFLASNPDVAELLK